MRNVVQLSLPANNILLMRPLLRENGSFPKNVQQTLLEKVVIVMCMSILYLAIIKTRGHEYVWNAARRYWEIQIQKRWTDIRMQLIDVG